MATDTEDLKTEIDAAAAAVAKAGEDLTAKLEPAAPEPVVAETIVKPKGYNQATGEFVL
jgi:hypothetical protein